MVVREALNTRNIRVHQTLTGEDLPPVVGFPYTVVRDSEELVVLYLVEGTQTLRWRLEEHCFLEPSVNKGDCLRLLFPGKCYGVSLFFDNGNGIPAWYEGLFGESGRFRGWYVDLQTPMRRTEVGFDVSDEVLDIVVQPDRSWFWKNEAEFSCFVEMGIYSDTEAQQLRSVSAEVIQLIESRSAPFNDEWTNWRPLACSPAAEALPGWQFLPFA